VERMVLMAEPVNPSRDYKTTRGNGTTVSVRFYTGATTGTDTWAAAVEGVFAVKWGGIDLYEDTEREGYLRRKTSRYGLRLADLPSRPPMKSLILDGSDIWTIDTPEDTSPLSAVLQVDVTQWVGDEPP
jgi:hypothetical protein